MSETASGPGDHGAGGEGGPTTSGGAVGYTAHAADAGRPPTRSGGAVNAWGVLMTALGITLPTSLARCNRHRRALLRATRR